MKQFEQINKGYNTVFNPGKLSIGLVVPIESYKQQAIPTMETHIQVAKKADKLGFSTLWLRDIPFNVPSFGDAGQMFDPFTYLGFLAGQTEQIALGVASIALPLHHPVHVAKSAATIDQLSNGRLILGVASGDRYDEYPAMRKDYLSRGEQFREAFEYIRSAQDVYPELESVSYGNLKGHIDILPKATGHKLPLLMTGYSQQTLEWNAEHTDGWMSYPKDLYQQEQTIKRYREQVMQSGRFDKPFMQPLYVDLQNDDNFKPVPIHLGLRTGVNYLKMYLNQLQDIGVNHVAINLRFNSMDISETLDILAEKVLPYFTTNALTECDN